MREGIVAVALLAALFVAASPSHVRAQELLELPTLSLVPVDTLRLPARGVRGIAFRDSTAFLLVSSNTGLSIPEAEYEASIVALDLPSGRVETVLTERRAFEAGLTFDGDRLIAGGNGVGGQEALYVIDRTRWAIVATLPASGYHPAGLVADKAHLWQVDADARQFARIETEEGQISRRYTAPGFYPTGLAHDGFHLWNADAATGRIYRIRAHNGRADAVVAAESFLRPGEFVTLGWDGRRLWAVSAADDYAVRYSVPR